MTRGNRRLAVLASWFLLALKVSGQGTEPTLETKMKFLATAFNSQGTTSWTESIPDLFGATYTVTSSLTEVNADPSACSLSWTTVYTAADDKAIETYVVSLQSISSVGVQSYSQYRKSETTYKLEVSPETYVVVMKTEAPLAGKREFYHKNKLRPPTTLPNDREARVLFSSEQTANGAGDAIRQASKICATKRSGP
jgi:hypothetical protein